MKILLLLLSLVTLIAGIVCGALAAAHFFRGLHELRKPGSMATNVLGFLVFLSEESFTDAGPAHRAQFLMGLAIGTVLLLSAFGLKSLAGI